jgi:hypothetical protein
MNGAQCLTGVLDLYASAGELRLRLITLQATLREQQKVMR